MKYKVITNNASKLLKHLSDSKKQFFTSQDVKEFMSKTSNAYVKEFLEDLVHRQLIMRLQRGLYTVVPYDVAATDYFPDWNVVASHLVGDAEYYIGYYSAMQLHSLTTQPSYTVQVVVNKRMIPATKKIHNAKFQFIYHEAPSFFGIKKMWPDNFTWVYCSDLEKTMIDCLYKPQYAMGITEVAKALYKVKDKINFEKLLKYFKQYNKQVAVKRLGFLLDLYEIKAPIIPQLQEMITASYVSLDPSYPKEGKSNSRWHVLINFDIDTIKQAPFS